MNKPVFNNNNWPTNNLWNGINLLMNILSSTAVSPGLPNLSFSANMNETFNEYIVTVWISGFDRNDICIELNGNYLNVKANKKTQTQSNNPYFSGYGTSSCMYNRIFYVENVSVDNIRSSYNNGVLTLVLPKNSPSAGTFNQKYIK